MVSTFSLSKSAFDTSFEQPSSWYLVVNFTMKITKLPILKRVIHSESSNYILRHYSSKTWHVTFLSINGEF